MAVYGDVIRPGKQCRCRTVAEMLGKYKPKDKNVAEACKLPQSCLGVFAAVNMRFEMKKANHFLKKLLTPNLTILIGLIVSLTFILYACQN